MAIKKHGTITLEDLAPERLTKEVISEVDRVQITNNPHNSLPILHIDQEGDEIVVTSRMRFPRKHIVVLVGKLIPYLASIGAILYIVFKQTLNVP